MSPLEKISTSFSHIKSHQRSLYLACIMLFFWTLFDGTVSYMTPLKISQAGFSDTELGFILGFSSIAGGIFDFLLSKFLTNTHFRRIYLLMFILCFIYPFVLWQAKTIWLFLLAMGIWGFYYDLNNFASYDFIGRKFDHTEHSASFGIITIFKELGYMLAPLIAGLTLGSLSLTDWKPMLLMIIFLFISFTFYLVLRQSTSKARREYIERVTYKPLNLIKELSLWQQIGLLLLPPLLITTMFNIYDSFFWTLGPLLAQSYAALQPLNGLLLTVYTLPFLLVGFLVGKVTKKIGKKRTAFLGFLIGSCIISFFSLLHTPIFILGDVLLASFFVGFTIPAIQGAYADYISESPRLEKEIEALSDFSTNTGYVIGPIIAGFLADHLGNPRTFSSLGIAGVIVALILLIAVRKPIIVRVKIGR